jgi:hypothetical protein
MAFVLTGRLKAFIFGLFNDAVSSSSYISPGDEVINE